jgi:hypothetical protein
VSERDEREREPEWEDPRIERWEWEHEHGDYPGDWRPAQTAYERWLSTIAP